ncbi:MAG: GTP-binding protein [Candidatus Micrarchaeota archaeon]
MGIQEKIREIDEEMHRTQKNKATEFHLGVLKAKMAKLRHELISPSGTKSSGQTFDVKKSGDATVAIIGLPSVGKSTLLTRLTNAKSEVAAYDFTTLKCIPGMMEYRNARIQVLDLPGIIEGAKDGKGRGREVIAVARGADLILILLDAAAPKQIGVIERELYGFGIRLNSVRPDIIIKKKEYGGITINSTVKRTNISDREVMAILNEYKLHNADVVFRVNATVDELIDILEGNRNYVPAIVVVNKIDTIPLSMKSQFPPNYILISAESGLGIEQIREAIYRGLRLIRIYTRRRGEKADLEEPLMMRTGSTVAEVCAHLHRDLKKNFRYALITGKSVKHAKQRVGLSHIVVEGDVIYIVKK